MRNRFNQSPKRLHSSLCSMICSIICAIILCIFTPLAFASLPLNGSLAPMLQPVMPAIVNIKAQIKITDLATLEAIQKESDSHSSQNGDQNNSDNSSPVPDTAHSMGSGVIINAKAGYIITNAHVVDGAQVITVTLNDGRHYVAKQIGIDKPSDIALLQIKATDLTALPIGDSNKIKVGDMVAAVGNPFGLNQTVTSGIVSALGRTTLGIENYENFIQTDAPINPGNSGGALINMQGELIGINTAILAPDRGSIGIGFAIPANMAKSVITQLLEYGDVKRGVLGVAAQDLTPELATAFNLNSTNGAVVSEVLNNSPAAQSGIQVGDILTAVNGTEIKNASDVVNTIGFLRVNSKTTVSLLRNGKPITASVVLTDPKKREQSIAQQDPYFYGVALKNFSVLSPTFGNIDGILVVAIAPDSSAWHADLRPGDVILSANQTKVSTIEALKATVAKANKTVLLNVLRGPSALFLVINRE